MMNMNGGKRFTANEKLIAIRRVQNGESKASVARNIGVPESTLRGWCKSESKISYLSRQSSPGNNDTDLRKKRKLDVDGDEPYNLSINSTSAPAALDLSTSHNVSPSECFVVSPNIDLSTTVDQSVNARPTPSNDQLSDFASAWVRHRTLMASLSVAYLQTPTSLNPFAIPATNAQSLLNGMTDHQKSKFWNWYGYNTTVPVETTSPAEEQVLYHPLTKESQNDTEEVQRNCETEETSPKSSFNGHTKSRYVLDNLFLNNNTIHQDDEKAECDEINKDEALEHGEKFLQWLNSCSDPCVTTVQIMTLQTMIKNLKSGADRRNIGDH